MSRDNDDEKRLDRLSEELKRQEEQEKINQQTTVKSQKNWFYKQLIAFKKSDYCS